MAEARLVSDTLAARVRQAGGVLMLQRQLIVRG